MKKIITMFLCIFMCIAFMGDLSFSQDNKDYGPVEVLQIDPAIQGLWMLLGVSDNRGETFDEPPAPAPFCRVSSTSVLSRDGTTFIVKNVYEFKEDGVVYNQISFTNSNRIWVVSKPKPPYILVQIFKPIDPNKEISRLIIVQQ